MIHRLGEVVLRMLEPKDLEAIYAFKNEPEVANALGGFSRGYARRDLEEWLEFHRKRRDEVLWSIATADGDVAIGHVGLYQIDHRVRSAEFAIALGDARFRGRGLGKAITRRVVEYGFDMLNLNRIAPGFRATNTAARKLYESIGFSHEGVRRSAQWKSGQYVDVVLMGSLAAEYRPSLADSRLAPVRARLRQVDLFVAAADLHGQRRCSPTKSCFALATRRRVRAP